ncbi:hypothetical protein Tco_0424175 [Tanacetum coccineum]
MGNYESKHNRRNKELKHYLFSKRINISVMPVQDVANSCRTGAAKNVSIDPDVGAVQHIDSQEASLLQVISSPYTGDTSNLTTSSAATVTPTTSTVVLTMTNKVSRYVNESQSKGSCYMKRPNCRNFNHGYECYGREDSCVTGDYMRAEARCEQHDDGHVGVLRFISFPEACVYFECSCYLSFDS